jgi:CheY-like chemotaxis protein
MSATSESMQHSGTVRPAARTLLDAPSNAPRVLLLDQDAVTALALAVLLTPQAQLTHVTSVAAAIGKLRHARFGAVVVDPQYIEGNLSGLLDHVMDIPLLVYSAAEPTWREFADDFLPKPWTSPRTLWSSIARALGLPSPIFVGV